MTKQFWIMMAVGLAVVGIGLSVVLVGTKGAHLELDGSILKVRVMPLNDNASLVIVEASTYDDGRFLRRLADAVRSLKVGPAADLTTTMGPLIRPPEGPLTPT